MKQVGRSSQSADMSADKKRPAGHDETEPSPTAGLPRVQPQAVRAGSLFESPGNADPFLQRSGEWMLDDRRLCRLCMLAVIVSLFGEKALMFI